AGDGEGGRRRLAALDDREAVGGVVGAGELADAPERLAAAEVDRDRVDALAARIAGGRETGGGRRGGGGGAPAAPRGRARGRAGGGAGGTVSAAPSPGRASAVTVPIRPWTSSMWRSAAAEPASEIASGAADPAARLSASPAWTAARSGATSAAGTRAVR